ncbi:recombinase-like helix-turn-helix domain-containing protein [Streptomyces sp. NPDC014733]|uniref:recombinase-like helix-turn-helix domain-containing protein n=1 Tax=Streptomyces sp. NPDC014733 TaxID=3364885 RepID=UPI0036FDACF6
MNPAPYLEIHQSRKHEPTPYEIKLAHTLEEIFTQVGHELTDVVAGLNDRQVHTPDGAPWTEQSFRDEMHRLGA